KQRRLHQEITAEAALQVAQQHEAIEEHANELKDVQLQEYQV
ncbi:MAG: hypothetical protein EZS28_030150, partial [Streblomastix strix]